MVVREVVSDPPGCAAPAVSKYRIAALRAPTRCRRLPQIPIVPPRAGIPRRAGQTHDAQYLSRCGSASTRGPEVRSVTSRSGKGNPAAHARALRSGRNEFSSCIQHARLPCQRGDSVGPVGHPAFLLFSAAPHYRRLTRHFALHEHEPRRGDEEQEHEPTQKRESTSRPTTARAGPGALARATLIASRAPRRCPARLSVARAMRIAGLREVRRFARSRGRDA
jgi:hypothetical protein